MQSVIFAKNGSWPVATSASRSTRRAPPSIQGGTERPECRCAPPTAGQIEAHSAPPSRSCSGAGVGRQGGRRGAYLVREQVRDATRRRCACARRYVVNAERVRRGGEGDVAPGVWGGRAVRISRRASTTRQGMSLSGALRRERGRSMRGARTVRGRVHADGGPCVACSDRSCWCSAIFPAASAAPCKEL